MEFKLDPKRIIQLMVGIIVVLTAMHITQLVIYYQTDDPDIFDYIEILDFDFEANLPSFYSALAIMFCAVLLWMIGTDKRRKKQAYRYHWLGLAIIFTFLGIDEAIALHEEIGDVVRDHEWVEAKGFLYFSWVVPYSILLLIFVASYLKFVFSLPRQTMILFIVSGSLFVTGAIGIEIFGAKEADLYGTDTLRYSILYTIEELCEMFGIVIFCYALLRYIEEQNGQITLGIKSIR